MDLNLVAARPAWLTCLVKRIDREAMRAAARLDANDGTKKLHIVDNAGQDIVAGLGLTDPERFWP
jgi:hypothetical protein